MTDSQQDALTPPPEPTVFVLAPDDERAAPVLRALVALGLPLAIPAAEQSRATRRRDDPVRSASPQAPLVVGPGDADALSRERESGSASLLVLVATPRLELADGSGARVPDALWRLAADDHFLREALRAASGLPTFVIAPGALPITALVEFFARHHVSVDAGSARQEAAAARVPQTSQTSQTAQAALLPEITALASLAASLVGPHDCLAADPGPASPWARALVQERAARDAAFAGFTWAAGRLEWLFTLVGSGAPREVSVPKTPEDGGPYPLDASQDLPAYHRWLEARTLATNVGGKDNPLRTPRTTPPAPKPGGPRISVLVPVWRTPRWILERCIGSVLNQDFDDWQLVVCDDASGDAELTAYLESLPSVDPRISVTALAENAGISAATNAALERATGEFVVFLDHDDELVPHALQSVARTAAAEPEADVIYSDEDKIDENGERFDPFFKPDWSPDLLLSYAYLAHLTAIRRTLVLEVGALRPDFDGSQDWDLSIRATERARRVVHIPDVLYHWRTLPASAASGAEAKPWAFAAGVRVLEDTLRRRGEEGEVTQHPHFPGRYFVRRAVSGHPLVSIIIPFRDEPGLLATCATSLRAAPGYDNFELVLVNNGSELPETAALLDRLSGEAGVRIVEEPGPFNWAAINNAATRAAAGDLFLFLNNDIEARTSRWLQALVAQATRPEVGAVGGRLLYPDGSIQHGGVVIALGGIAGHVLRNLPGDRPGYASMAISTRNSSVVTGACMMTRREVFESVGGFDERLPVAFNDVDFCLKLREKGYLVIYEALCELVHHESKSRGHTDDLVEGRRILERWGRAMAAGDPYLNANLSHWKYWCALSTIQEDERWNSYLETSASTPSSSSST